MPAADFSVDATEVDESETIFEMHGDITGAAHSGLDEAYQRLGAGTRGLVLDFADVDYINSTGIAVIVGILARARAVGTQVVAHGLTEHYRQIFEITRLSDFIGIYEDRGAAVRAAASG